MEDKPEIVHIQRKPRTAGNFSLEFIFNDVRKRLDSKFRFRVLIVNRISNGIWNRIINIFQVGSHQGRINHVTGDIHYVTYLLRTKGTILTILDCGFITQSAGLKRNLLKFLWLTIPVQRSQYITAISQATKSDIIRFTNCTPSKITVIPVAVDEIYKPRPKLFNADLPRLLQIGTSANKNLDRLIEAIIGMNCVLVVIGKLTEVQLKLLMKNSINYINRTNLSQQEIYNEYCLADIVTFVSTFEGFGMPIIEANCVERPVIAGNNSSMPEVGSNAAYYVDATTVESIREGLVRLFKDENLRNDLIQNGRINRLKYANETIANMYGNLYIKALKVQ